MQSGFDSTHQKIGKEGRARMRQQEEQSRIPKREIGRTSKTVLPQVEYKSPKGTAELLADDLATLVTNPVKYGLQAVSALQRIKRGLTEGNWTQFMPYNSWGSNQDNMERLQEKDTYDEVGKTNKKLDEQEEENNKYWRAERKRHEMVLDDPKILNRKTETDTLEFRPGGEHELQDSMINFNWKGNKTFT